MSAENQKTILLVEDEVVTAMGEKITLNKLGYKVITAKSGEEAVKTVIETPAIDLILMDINLGAGIDGTEAAEIILQERDLPVVFLSSHTEPEIVAKTEKITSYGYVVKASSNTVLQASINMAFKLFEAKIKEKEKESQMEAALAALRESEASYRVLLLGASDGILLADSQTKKFCYANPAICRMLGYTEEEFLRISVADIHPKESIDYVLAEFEALARGEIVSSSDIPCLRKDGTLFYTNISHSVMVLEGREYHAGFFQDITERKRAEEELRRRNKYIESILDNMPIGFAVNTIDDGVARYLNDNFVKIYGWPREVLTDVNQFFEKVYPGAEGRELKARIISDMNSGDPKKMAWDDLKIITSTGEHRYISSRNIPIHEQNLMVSTVWDSTQIHESQAALRESEEKYRTLFTSSSDAIMLIEPLSGKFISGNQTTLEMFGLKNDDNFSSFGPWDFSPERQPDGRASVEKAKKMNEIAMRDGYNFFEWAHKRLNSEEFPANVRLTRMVLDKKTILQATVRDITAHKRAEEEIKRQLAEKEILLKEVHHRIKNNIASIAGLISLHMQLVTNPEAIDVLKDARSRVNSLRLLYDKLLLSEDCKDISVKSYLEDLIDTIIAIFPDNAKIKFEKRIADFNLDSKRLFPLGIIINELLTNIMKHAFIKRNTGLIKIYLTNVDKHVTLTVQDNGNGLPAGFDINESNGFGLMLVKMLSQQLGGSFSIKKYAGTRCIIEFNI